MRFIAPNTATATAQKRKPRSTTAQRPYDPSVDGWNVHTLRHTPTLSQLIYRRDESGEDF